MEYIFAHFKIHFFHSIYLKKSNANLSQNLENLRALKISRQTWIDLLISRDAQGGGRLSQKLNYWSRNHFFPKLFVCILCLMLLFIKSPQSPLPRSPQFVFSSRVLVFNCLLWNGCTSWRNIQSSFKLPSCYCWWICGPFRRRPLLPWSALQCS